MVSARIIFVLMAVIVIVSAKSTKKSSKSSTKESSGTNSATTTKVAKESGRSKSLDDVSADFAEKQRKVYSIKLHQTANTRGACYGKKSRVSATAATDDDQNVDEKEATVASDTDTSNDCYTSDDMPKLTTAQKAWLESLAPTSTTFDAVARQEIRQLNVNQREGLFRAFNALKSKYIDYSSLYDILVNSYVSHSAQTGPSSLGLNREYLFRFEQALNRMSDGIGIEMGRLPYWDVTLDTYLPSMFDSILFTDDYFGTCKTGSKNVAVKSGPFAQWSSTNSCGSKATQLTRTCTTNFGGQLLGTFNDWDVDFLMKKSTFTELSEERCLFHNRDIVQKAITGTKSSDIKSPGCQINDPVMWFVNAYVDYLWEEYREKKKQDIEGEENSKKKHKKVKFLQTDMGGMASEDAKECEKPDYQINPFMAKKNKDTLSNKYKQFYIYEETPYKCETEDSECGTSGNYWCDTDASRCKSKLKKGASCSGLSSNACSTGFCDKKKRICKEVQIDADDTNSE